MKISRIIAALMALVIAPLLMVSPVSIAAIPGGIAPMQGACQESSSTINIYNYEKTPSDNDGVGDGKQKPNVTGTPIVGASFALRQILSVDGEKVPGQAALGSGDPSGVESQRAKLAELFKKLQDPAAQIKFGKSSPSKGEKTNEKGLAQFSVDYGLYEVSEFTAPDGYDKAKAFYVMMPSADHKVLGEDGNSECEAENLYFYPKSEKLPTLEKTVKDDAATGVGSPISYTLKGSVSSAEPGKYVISDQLSQKVKLKSVTVKIGDLTLNAPADYTLAGTVDEVGQKVVVTLTEAGLAKLKTAYEASPDVKVSVDINGEVAAIAGADNIVLKNKASLKPSSDSKWDTSPVLSNEVATKFGGIKIHKVDYLKESQSLAGAKFKVYATKADADAQANELKFLNAAGAETTEAETDGKGNAIIEGLHVSDFANGKAAAQPTTYWVRETVAPEGYSVLPEPIEVTVASAADANNAGLVALTDKQIEDVAVNAQLRIPNTGLYGPFGYVLVGGLVIIIGAVVFIARRDR